MVNKPIPQNSESAKELDKVAEQFDMFNENVEKMTHDRMNQTPITPVEPQSKFSQNEIARMSDIYLKPHRTVSCNDKFNEDYRKDYEFQKEYVHFQAENKEIIGEQIDIWTRPFAGMPAEWWKVPVNKPVWGPRYLAEQLKRCYYHRLIMGKPTSNGQDSLGNEFVNTIAIDSTVQRLDAIPVNDRKSIFMGATKFG